MQLYIVAANGDAKNGEEERKRKSDGDKIEEVQPAKKAKLADIIEEDDDIVCIDWESERRRISTPVF